MSVKFSIVVCNYNNGIYFKQCLNSLLAQTFNDFEVIIVDDSSTDDSVEIIRNLIANDSKFKLFQNEENRGYSFSLDRGIRLASGELVARLDPDDAITPDAISSVVGKFNQPNTVAVYTQMYLCDKDLNVSKVFMTNQKVKNNDKLFFNIFFKVNHFFAFRKKAYLEMGGLDVDLSNSVDQDLYLKLYEKGDFEYIAEPKYYYRTHPKGISQDVNKKAILQKNRDAILRNTLKRRGIQTLYGKKVDEISVLQNYIWTKQNTILEKIKRKLKI